MQRRVKGVNDDLRPMFQPWYLAWKQHDIALPRAAWPCFGIVPESKIQPGVPGRNVEAKIQPLCAGYAGQGLNLLTRTDRIEGDATVQGGRIPKGV